MPAQFVHGRAISPWLALRTFLRCRRNDNKRPLALAICRMITNVPVAKA
jgi:hypothetical protein